jgi:hypothetical protein
MTSKEDLAPPKPARGWTRADDYFAALARRRTARRQRSPKPRTQPESPRLLLSTLPFAALLAALGVLAVAIMVTAWPGSQPQHKPKPVAYEQGYAPPGWLKRAGVG